MAPYLSTRPHRDIRLATRPLARWLIFNLPLSLLLTLLATLAQGNMATGQATGSITGHVTASDGGNLGPLVVFAADVVNNAQRGETTLDATGRYTLTDLPAGNYRVEFNFDNDGPYLPEYYNDARAFGDLDPVPVTAGSTTGGIDAVLQRGGTITGRVVDADTDNPIAGINVRTLGVLPGQSTLTDASGHYTLTALTTANYSVCFATEFNENDLYLPECYDNKSSDLGAERTPISITEGMTVSNINAALILGGMITGRVTNELTGAPLPSVRATATGSDDSAFAETDAAGFYTITTLITGTYIVAFSGSSDYSEEYYNNKTSEADADPIAVTPGVVVTNINGTLISLVSITGRVVLASSGEPLRAVRVAAYDSTGDRLASELSLDTGHYTLTALPPGDYFVRFSDSRYNNQYYDDRTIFEEATPVTVVTHAVTSNIDAALVPRQFTDLAVATARTRPDAILIARDGHFGPIFTLDGGASWQGFKTLPFAPSNRPPQVALVPKDNPVQPLRFLLGPASGVTVDNDGIYRTGDAGSSWATFEPPVDPRCASFSPNTVENLVTSPIDPLRVYGATECTKGTTEGGEPVENPFRSLHTSSDGGVTWQLVTMPPGPSGFGSSSLITLQPSPAAPERVYAQYGSGLLDRWQRSDNHGQTWITETFTLISLAWDWTDAAKLYGVEDSEYPDILGSGENVFHYTGKRSDNHGATWADWTEQPCRTSFRQLLALPAANTLLILCDQGLLRSTNGGDTWELLTAQTGGTLATHNGDHEVTLWMRGSEFWASRDQGATWTNLGGWRDVHLPSIQVVE